MRRYLSLGIALGVVVAALGATSCAKKEDSSDGYVSTPANAGPDRKGGGAVAKDNLPANVQAGDSSKE